MRTDKFRKYILPNIPYLFIGWACLKVGTAYRLAAGTDCRRWGQPLPTLRRALILLTGLWVLWVRQAFGC